MKKGTLLDIAQTIVDNDGEFFTSGIENAKRNLEETRKDFKLLTIIISLICIASFLIRVLLF